MVFYTKEFFTKGIRTPPQAKAFVWGTGKNTPKMVRFLLDNGADPNLWCKQGVHHEPHGGVEGDALQQFNATLCGLTTNLDFQGQREALGTRA